MKLLLIIIALTTSAVASDLRAFMWQESRDEKTKEARLGFFIASEATKEVFEAEARGDSDRAKKLAQKLPADAWIYGILLHGEAATYSKSKISIMRGHDLVEVQEGQISLDSKTRTVLVALTVIEDGKSVTFRGNGKFVVSALPKE